MAGAARDDDEGITDINITPLVDIILVLLIIFMMTASYIVSPAIEVNLPKAANATETPQTSLALVLTREGDLYMNAQKVGEPELRRFIQSERAAGKDPEAIIGADAAVAHGRVIALIDLIKGEGVTKFAFTTQSEFTAESMASPPPSPSPSP
jgi:biopolymer transport protein TolR